MTQYVFASLLLVAGCGDVQARLEAGYAYGESHDLLECRVESLRRLEACKSTKCEVLSTGFARGCAKTSRFNPSACVDVPSGVLAASSWMERECGHSVNPKACYKVLQQPVARCLGDAL